MKHRFAPYWIAAGVFALDRLTKLAVASRVSSWDKIVVIPRFFNIVHAENPGAAFSLFAGSTSQWRNLALITLSAVVAAFIGALLWQPARHGLGNSPTLRLGLSLVLGGAVGNLYDRVLSGTVTDFLDFYSGTYHWPAFNVADSAITLGAVFLLYDLWRSRRKAALQAQADRTS